jgi:hypothetical protein
MNTTEEKLAKRKRIIRNLLAIIGLLLIAVVIIIVGLYILAWYSGKDDPRRNQEPTNDPVVQILSDTEFIGNLFDSEDFPPFDYEAFEYYDKDSTRVIVLECEFNPPIYGKSEPNIRLFSHGFYIVSENSMGGYTAAKAWTNSSDMDVPRGLQENMKVEFNYYDYFSTPTNRFNIEYRSNNSDNTLNKKDIRKMININIPDFKIISNNISTQEVIIEFIDDAYLELPIKLSKTENWQLDTVYTIDRWSYHNWLDAAKEDQILAEYFPDSGILCIKLL